MNSESTAETLPKELEIPSSVVSRLRASAEEVDSASVVLVETIERFHDSLDEIRSIVCRYLGQLGEQGFANPQLEALCSHLSTSDETTYRASTQLSTAYGSAALLTSCSYPLIKSFVPKSRGFRGARSRYKTQQDTIQRGSFPPGGLSAPRT